MFVVENIFIALKSLFKESLLYVILQSKECSPHDWTMICKILGNHD